MSETSAESSPQATQESRNQTWKQIEAQVENMRDGPGFPVDDGIKDAVIAFNAMGLNTRQSCEGHLDRGQAAPWVDIQVDGMEEKVEQFEQAYNQAEAAEMSGQTEDIVDQLYLKAHGLREEARKPHLETAKQVMELLNEFYTDRPVPHHVRLTIKNSTSYFRVESQGAFLQDIAEDDITKAQNLSDYQREMAEFTNFLKNKYFS